MKKSTIAQKTFYCLFGGGLILIFWYVYLYQPIRNFGEYGKEIMINHPDGFELFLAYWIALIVGLAITVIGIGGLVKLGLDWWRAENKVI